MLCFSTVVKNDNIQMKSCKISHIFAQNMDCGFTSTHNLCFRENKAKNDIYTFKPKPYVCSLNYSSESGSLKSRSTIISGTLLHEDLVMKKLSRIMRKPAFCICKNKDTDQLHGYR